MNWKHRGNASDYRSFVKDKTGLAMENFQKTNLNYRIKDLDKVRDILLQAAANKEEVTAVGDYDADGIGSIFILASLFKEIGIKFSLIIPKRLSEGYGISEKIVERITSKVVFTIDNGISAIKPIRKLKEKGVTVVILDHHMAVGELPPADVIIDPEALSGSADYSHYCGAGLGFKLAEYILPKDNPNLPVMNAVAAISTIGDSVPLTGDNRRIVRQGMLYLKTGYCTAGMLALMDRCKINAHSTAKDIAFNLVPCLNAPGRLEDSGSIKSVRALWSNGSKANELADELIQINQSRKEIVAKAIEGIDFEKIRASTENSIVVYLPDVPEGIAGLIAGRLAEETSKPSVAIVNAAKGILKGSCRSQKDNIHLKNTLDKMSHLFLSYGGHKKAAAFSINKEYLDLFRKGFNENLPEYVRDDSIYYDFEIIASEIPSLLEELDAMQPFGEGNPEPVIMIRNMPIGNQYGEKISFMGTDKEHIKLHFKTFSAIGFHMAEQFMEQIPEDTCYVDIIGYLEKNYYKDRVFNQIRLIDIRASQIKSY